MDDFCFLRRIMHAELALAVLHFHFSNAENEAAGAGGPKQNKPLHVPLREGIKRPVHLFDPTASSACTGPKRGCGMRQWDAIAESIAW